MIQQFDAAYAKDLEQVSGEPKLVGSDVVDAEAKIVEASNLEAEGVPEAELDGELDGDGLAKTTRPAEGDSDG